MSTFFARFMRIERIVVLVTLSIFTLIVLAMNAAYANVEQNTELTVPDAFGFRVQVWPSAVDTFAVFNIVVCILTKATLLPINIINRLRRGAFTSMIVFELCWIGLLDVFWIAAAGLTTDQFQGAFSNLCQANVNNDNVDNLHLACGATQASMAFSFLNFIILTVHIVMLLTLAIMYQQKGVSVWKRSVSDVAGIQLKDMAPPSTLTGDSQEQIPMKGGMAAYPPPAAVNVQPYVVQQPSAIPQTGLAPVNAQSPAVPYPLQPPVHSPNANDGYTIQV